MGAMVRDFPARQSCTVGHAPDAPPFLYPHFTLEDITMAYTPQPTRYTVNHRIMRDYEDANLYWQVHGGVLMEKIDGLPAHVLQSKPLTSQ